MSAGKALLFNKAIGLVNQVGMLLLVCRQQEKNHSDPHFNAETVPNAIFTCQFQCTF